MTDSSCTATKVVKRRVLTEEMKAYYRVLNMLVNNHRSLCEFGVAHKRCRYYANSVVLNGFQWRIGLRLGSAAARLLGLLVWILPGTSLSVCCECRVLSGRGLCVWLITRPEESYRLWCVCDREASIMKRPWRLGAVLPWEKKMLKRALCIITIMFQRVTIRISCIMWRWDVGTAWPLRYLV